MRNQAKKKSENRTAEVRHRIWLTENQAARYLGVTRRTLFDWRKNGITKANGAITAGPPYYQPAGRYYYDQNELDEWISGGRA